LADLTGALKEFASAADAARSADVPGGEEVAAVAEANAVMALMVLGASEEAASSAAALGLEGALSHHRRLQEAMAGYDEGIEAFDTAQFEQAQSRFAKAAATFEELGETDYAARAHQGRVWAAYNRAVPLPPAQALAAYSAIQAEAETLGDPELGVRIVVASAMAAQALGMQESSQWLASSAKKAASLGFPELAARCHAALADQDGPLVERVHQARLAFSLDPQAVESVYALYSVAVDAYNADEFALAAALAREAMPYSGDLQDSLQAVLTAATEP
jgi:hypothetical protein